MLKLINWPRARAERYHRFLPEEIGRYLKGRGIPATLIASRLLGWEGKRITIPIPGRERHEILGFRYATPPADLEGAPVFSSDADAAPELYGWDTLLRKPNRVVITDNEFDRLVLEAHGFPAVCSTAGADTFLETWIPFFAEVRHVYICFRRDAAGQRPAKELRALLPAAQIVTLPAGADTATDFFRLGHTQVDFEVLLAAAARDTSDGEPQPHVREIRPYRKALQKRADRAKSAVPLHEIVAEYTALQASGAHLVGNCPLHDDTEQSFRVYPATNTYSCSVCGAEGDAITFLMNKESRTYGQALEDLERFAFTHELFGAAS
jgi:hypothetical protein